MLPRMGNQPWPVQTKDTIMIAVLTDPNIRIDDVIFRICRPPQNACLHSGKVVVLKFTLLTPQEPAGSQFLAPEETAGLSYKSACHMVAFSGKQNSIPWRVDTYMTWDQINMECSWLANTRAYAGVMYDDDIHRTKWMYFIVLLWSNPQI